MVWTIPESAEHLVIGSLVFGPLLFIGGTVGIFGHGAGYVRLTPQMSFDLGAPQEIGIVS